MKIFVRNYEANIQSNDHYLSMSLWHNSLIRIDKKNQYITSNGAQKALLMKDSSTFLSFSEFKKRFHIETNFFTFHRLVSTITSI